MSTADRYPYPEPLALQLLEEGEQVHQIARATDAVMLVTDRRIAVANAGRVAMDVPWDHLRRIQFDVERSRPATLVIVPDRPRDQPQVLAIEPERYEEVAQAIAIVGRRLADLD